MKNKFKRINIEITNNCNLCCSFCPQNNREKKFMSPAEFEYIAKQISPLTNNIYLHVMGEPLLHPQLNQILEIAKANGLQINIVTNGTLLKQNAKIILNANIKKLTISLHSYEANKQIISLDQYLQNAIELAKQLQTSTNTITEFRLWNQSTKNEIAKNSLNEKIIETLQKNFAVKLDITSTKKNYTLAKNVFLGFDNVFVWPECSMGKTQEEKKFCYALRTHFGILCDGTVVPCCLDNDGLLVLGNIFKQDINNILHCERAKKIYDGFSCQKAVEPLCKTCLFATRFNNKKPSPTD